jgi:hypothetical protein
MQEINYNEETLNQAINETYLITENGLMFEGWINEEVDIE